MHLYVHLIEGLLHPLNAASPLVDEIRHLAPHGAHPRDGLVRPEGPAKKATAVQQLQPLAILVVALPSRDAPQLASVDEHDLDPM